MGNDKQPSSIPSSFFRGPLPISSMASFAIASAQNRQPPQQPSLGSMMFKSFQSSLWGKSLKLASNVIDEGQNLVKTPLANGLKNVVNEQAADIAASKFVGFFTPPGMTIVQGMNKFVESGGKDGKLDVSLTAVKAAVSKMNPMASLLVNQADKGQAIGEAFYESAKASKGFKA